MATHSSILAWRIAWTEEPIMLQSMGSQRVRHDWACTHTQVLNKENLGITIPGRSQIRFQKRQRWVPVHKASQSWLNSQLLSVAPSSPDEISVAERSRPLWSLSGCQAATPPHPRQGPCTQLIPSVSTSPGLTLRITGLLDHRFPDVFQKLWTFLLFYF